MSSLNKRVNPPPKIAISGAMVTSSSGDDVVLTTPDIAGTVTTPGMMDMLSKNSVPTFNQFSLAPVSSATTTTPNSTTITTMTPVHARYDIKCYVVTSFMVDYFTLHKFNDFPDAD